MPGPEYLQHIVTHLWHQRFPAAITFFCFWENEGLCELVLGREKKTPSWFSLIMRSVKQCSVHFWPNSVFPSLLSVLHCTEHTQLETAQTMHVRLRQHFLQHLLFGRKGLLQEWCKKWSSSALLGTKSLPAAKTSVKKLMIWMKIQGKADISGAVLHFKTARNAKTVKIPVALQC